MTYTIWPARPSDIDVVMGLLHARIDWLRARGSDQWSTWQRWRPEVQDAIAFSNVLLLCTESGDPVGTMSLSDDGDPEFWTEEERNVPALYVSKLATHPDVAGRGLGRLMLDYALYLARARRLAEIRLDVWRTSTQLQRWYELQGWRHVRTVVLAGRFSGWLGTRYVDSVAYNHPPTGLEIRPPQCSEPSGTTDFSYAMSNPNLGPSEALRHVGG